MPGSRGLMIQTGRDFLEENPALPRRQILVQHSHGPSPAQGLSNSLNGPGRITRNRSNPKLASLRLAASTAALPALAPEFVITSTSSASSNR